MNALPVKQIMAAVGRSLELETPFWYAIIFDRLIKSGMRADIAYGKVEFAMPMVKSLGVALQSVTAWFDASGGLVIQGSVLLRQPELTTTISMVVKGSLADKLRGLCSNLPTLEPSS